MSSDPNAGKASIPLWQRIRAWAIVGVLYGFVLALAVAGFVVLQHTFTHGLDIAERLYRLFGAALLLTIPALAAWQFIRIKRKTGRWMGTRDQQQQRVAQCVMRPQRRILPQQRSLLLFGLHWANIALRDPQSPLLKRVLGLAVLIVYAVALLAVIAISVLFIGAGIATFASLGWIMIFFGLILLVIPAQFIAALVRLYRANGNLRSSADDLTGIKAARGVWVQQQRQQPLRTKLISTAVCIVVLTILWLRVTLYHSRHPQESWVTPLFWTIIALYLIWNQFRNPNSAPTK